jgi:asparagine synthase (glutamine-hydrolysing)
MCGIAGSVGRYDLAMVAAMTDRLAHRGPDGSGLWHDEATGVALGHRRLAIIDLSNAAAQPMAGVDGRYQIVFNGEIYNFRDHTAPLQAAGYRFNTHSDTAILPALYDRHGPAMLERLNGMFAFAIWDTVEQRLFLARDHCGIKPLYYAQTPRGFVFASEMKAMLCVPDIDRTIDIDALSQYLTYQWCPGRLTPFAGVKKLPPGHYLEVDGSSVSETRWYVPPFGRVHDFDNREPEDLRDELRTLLDDVVEEQAVADVGIGAFLSGGVDSTAVVGAMIRRKVPVAHTYCISFRGASMASEGFDDDVTFARDVANQWKLPFKDIVFEEPSIEDLTEMAFQLDEPQGDISPLFVRHISREARADGIKVLMSGVGGDDALSGYRRHQVAWLSDAFPRLTPAIGLIAGIGANLSGGTVGGRLKKLSYMLSASTEENLRRQFVFNPPEDIKNVAGDVLRHRINQGSTWIDDGLASTRGAPTLERALAGEFLGFVPDHNLAYTDKASMAEGVEVRVPLLDPRMLDFASRLSPRLKMRFGRPKSFLKAAMTDRLPRAILRRKKTGFGAPIRHWLAGKLRGPFLDVIRSAKFRDRGFFDPLSVERLLGSASDRRVEGAYLLLTIVMIELWCRQFVDSQPTKDRSSGIAADPTH